MRRLVASFAVGALLLTGCGTVEDSIPQALIAATTAIAPAAASTSTVTSTSKTSSSTTSTTSSSTTTSTTSSTSTSPSPADQEVAYAAALLAAGIDASDPAFAFASVAAACVKLTAGRSAGTIDADLVKLLSPLDSARLIALRSAAAVACPDLSPLVTEATKAAETALVAATSAAAAAARVAEEQRVAAEAAATQAAAAALEAANAQAAAQEAANAQAAANEQAAADAAAEAAQIAEAQVPIQPAAGAFYKNCDAVRAANAAPIYADDPGFQQKFDRDNDGVGCEN